MKPFEKKIYLSTPTMHGEELKYMTEAYETNWMSTVGANINEANYGQSKADMLSKFQIALKECNETEGWLQLLLNTSSIDEITYKHYRNLCGRIRRMLIASSKTLKTSAKN